MTSKPFDWAEFRRRLTYGMCGPVAVVAYPIAKGAGLGSWAAAGVGLAAFAGYLAVVFAIEVLIQLRHKRRT